MTISKAMQVFGWFTNAATLMDYLNSREDLIVNQDWSGGITTWIFNDGSRIEICGEEVQVED